MAYRHEWKHVISPADLLVLRQRLPLLMEWDPHATGGEYLVRSLYFDNAADTILREKLDGVNVREKFRLRYYNGDPTFLRLEKKSKINGLCLKQTAPLSSAQVQSLLRRETAWMKAGEPLHRELYDGMLHRGLRPKTVVDYTREPFVLSAGHVRVTLDYNLRTAACCGRRASARSSAAPSAPPATRRTKPPSSTPAPCRSPTWVLWAAVWEKI